MRSALKASIQWATSDEHLCKLIMQCTTPPASMQVASTCMEVRVCWFTFQAKLSNPPSPSTRTILEDHHCWGGWCRSPPIAPNQGVVLTSTNLASTPPEALSKPSQSGESCFDGESCAQKEGSRIAPRDKMSAHSFLTPAT